MTYRTRPPRRPQLSVLVVEDDDDDFLIARQLLTSQEGWRFEVERAATYEEALRAIDERRHDVYLVDYRLGAHTGLDLVRECFTRRSARRCCFSPARTTTRST